MDNDVTKRPHFKARWLAGARQHVKIDKIHSERKKLNNFQCFTTFQLWPEKKSFLNLYKRNLQNWVHRAENCSKKSSISPVREKIVKLRKREIILKNFSAMVQRLTYRRTLSYNTSSNRRKIVKTPGGKLVYQHISKAVCIF